MTTDAEHQLVTALRELTAVVLRTLVVTAAVLGTVAAAIDPSWCLGFAAYTAGALTAFGAVYLALRHLERLPR